MDQRAGGLGCAVDEAGAIHAVEKFDGMDGRVSNRVGLACQRVAGCKFA